MKPLIEGFYFIGDVIFIVCISHLKCLVCLKSLNTEQLKLNQTTIDAKYTLTQFKKDFPISANNQNNIVLMLNASELKHYLKNPTDFDAAYTSALYFKFQNGKLASLEINQGIAC